MGMVVRLGQEWHSCGIRKHGVEQGELWAGVRETFPGAACEGLLLRALQSASVGAVCHLHLHFRSWEMGRGEGIGRCWAIVCLDVCQSAFHNKRDKAGFSDPQFHLELKSLYPD